MIHTTLLYSTTTLLFLYVPIVIAIHHPTTIDGDTLVLDADGNPLKPGLPYYIRTEISKVGIGGGIVTASKPGYPQCPQFVAQLALGWYPESPVTFHPTNQTQKHIYMSSNLNIMFNTNTSVCTQGAWHLTPDATNGYLYLSTGTPNSGSETIASWFKIEKSIAGLGLYQLEYCPTTSTARNDIVCGVIDALPDYSEDLRLLWLGFSTQSPNFFHLLSFLKA